MARLNRLVHPQKREVQGAHAARDRRWDGRTGAPRSLPECLVSLSSLQKLPLISPLIARFDFMILSLLLVAGLGSLLRWYFGKQQWYVGVAYAAF